MTLHWHLASVLCVLALSVRPIACLALAVLRLGYVPGKPAREGCASSDHAHDPYCSPRGPPSLSAGKLCERGKVRQDAPGVECEDEGPDPSRPRGLDCRRMRIALHGPALGAQLYGHG